MANRNIATKTTSERLAGLLNSYFAKKSDVVNSLAPAANKGIEIGGTSTNPTVGIKLSVKEGNSLSFATGENEDGGLFYRTPAAQAISVVEKATPNTGYLKSYQVTVNGVVVGVDIDIPKDFLVKSATSSVVTAADKEEGGKFHDDANFAVGDTYLDFVINVKSGTATDSHVYVNVSNLVDVYHNGNGLNLDSSTNTFSIKIDTSNANGLVVTSDGLKLGLASASANGAMSSSDFTKLAGISAQANKTESSQTNGNIKIDGVETTVYALPNTVVHEDDLSDYTEAELRVLLGLPAAE